MMKWPLLALKCKNNLYRPRHQMTYAMYLLILGCNKLLHTEWHKLQKCIPCFSGSRMFQIRPCIGVLRKTVVLGLDCHHLLTHVTSPLMVPSEFLLQGHHSLSVEDYDHTYDLI